MQRVLHVIDHTDDGGAQVVVYHFIRRLRERFVFAVAVLGKSGRFSKAYEALGIPVFELGTNGSRWNPWPIVSLVDVIRQQKFELVHTHLFKSSIIGTIAAKWTGARTILHDHWGVDPESLKYHIPNRTMRRIYIEIYRYALRVCDRTLVLTEEDIKSYLKYYSFESPKIMVLPNAVDSSDFNSPDNSSASTLQIREYLGLATDTRLVVMIARLEPEKDWLTFLRVAQRVKETVKQSCAFLIIGSGSQEQTLRNYINTRKLNGIFFLGYRDDVPLLLRQADVFLLTSRFERFGIVVLEAMAAGCPVVATRSGGPQSILTHAIDGLLAEVGDVEGLANHVVRLLHDTALSGQIVQRAKQAVSQRYSLQKTVSCLTAIYTDVLRDSTRNSSIVQH